MRTEREVRDKLESMETMLKRVRRGDDERMECDIMLQIDMLLWFLEDESGLPPLDEDPTYSCYNGKES